MWFCTPFYFDFLLGLRDVDDRFEEVVAPSSHLKDDEKNHKRNIHCCELIGLHLILPHAGFIKQREQNVIKHATELLQNQQFF